MELNLSPDLERANAQLQERVQQLEKENALLRWQLAEGFRDSVRDFSDSLMDSLDPGTTEPGPLTGTKL